MKLSEKGLKKLERHEQIKKLGYVSLIDEIEFEPDDFKGMVCLTVEEAKEIIGTYIGTQWEVVKKHGSSELKFKNPSWILNLLDRINQAEKDNASH